MLCRTIHILGHQYSNHSLILDLYRDRGATLKVGLTRDSKYWGGGRGKKHFCSVTLYNFQKSGGGGGGGEGG